MMTDEEFERALRYLILEDGRVNGPGLQAILADLRSEILKLKEA
jgi:hypothetical protein